MSRLAKYNKFTVAACGFIAAGLGSLNGVSWAPVAASAVTALAVLLVPNKGKRNGSQG